MESSSMPWNFPIMQRSKLVRIKQQNLNVDWRKMLTFKLEYGGGYNSFFVQVIEWRRDDPSIRRLVLPFSNVKNKKYPPPLL